ncbi:GNAT family N-acetyltransferase [Bacteriovorax sp. PP10]|uniref:GNAT family N-acetyltransferase n=1 Tax=Bacteriovorax antarcticus TaxID=3088717 RepID=A0ABU5VVR4_9BACT|nr:GNAT family N-acetyltransferase [Bacteriovorax sp. PP10]MEA9356120.1 GNAT family N-acetyltransferase [Bacteriovorax sp. PP10]
MANVKIVAGTEADIPEILKFIKALAVYEKLEHEAVATHDLLKKNLFGEERFAEVIFIQEDDVKVGFALFFKNFSTFLGLPGIYLEDLFVLPECRGKGYGKKLIVHIAKIAVDRGYGRFEWSVLDWNTPAIEFYHSIGAIPMDEWTVQRMTGDTLKKLASL